jgi:hypothetical protein
MAMYLLRCQYGSHRYWRAIRLALACTHDELPREVARKAGVNLLHVVALEVVPNLQVAHAYGVEWIAGRP